MLTFKSPSGRFNARLDQLTTCHADGLPSQTGFLYYKTIWLTDQRFAGHHFTGTALWSSNNRYFAAEEWIVTDSLEQAFENHDCRLLVFDFQQNTEAVVSSVSHGNIVPFQFESDLLVCHAKKIGQEHAPKVTAIDVSLVTEWSAVGELRHNI